MADQGELTIQPTEAPMDNLAQIPMDGSDVKPQSLAEENAAKTQEAQRPEWLDEKFATPEDLANSYKELEKKLSQRGQVEKDNATPAPEDTPQDNAKVDEKAKEATAAAGLDIVALSQEYRDNENALTPETYEKLGQAGISKEMVNDYISLKTAEADSAVDTIVDVVGSKEDYSTLMQWANDYLPQTDQQAFNKIVETGDIEASKLAVRGLLAQYHQAAGEAPNLIETLTPSSGGSNVGAFKSTAEMVRAMQDPLYQQDPAYRHKVAQRLAISNLG